jgi:site-specific DNA-methyltransferase (adenine-specific)
MKDIPDKSIDMILCDLPYGTTACKWDTIIPFEPLWEQYKRIIKDNGAIVLTASQPFTSALVMSNIKMFKYEIIWDKVNISNPLLAKKQILKAHENICVFYKSQPTYNPQMSDGKMWRRGGSNKTPMSALNVGMTRTFEDDRTSLKYPKSIQIFSNADNTNRVHPTQKPVALFEYLIKTYTNEGDLVLDNCAGSGTTGVACKNLNRNYILIEKEPEYINIINQRLTNI